MQHEIRAAQLEVRAKGRKLEGHAALFNVEADIGGMFRESISPGAFAATLADRHDILGLVDHDASRVLGRTRAGSLRLAEDSRGLAFDLDVPDTTAGRDILALVESRNAGGCSFSFALRENGDTWQGDKRTLLAVDLFEVSIVAAWPAYQGTDVAARALSRSSRGHWRVSLARRWLDTIGA